MLMIVLRRRGIAGFIASPLSIGALGNLFIVKTEGTLGSWFVRDKYW